ncbi:MAG: hypothetical protein JEY91_04980 [Spirochaetaceae bacterium]|nr:hypothetical protein [Spirochaetaceae bacterium]
MKIQKIGILIFCTIILSACTTTETLYQSENSFLTIKGSSGKSIAFLTEKSNKQGLVWTELTSVFIPGITIKGSLEKREDGLLFAIESAELFSNWNNGWTEAVYEASGTYGFKSINGSEREFLCSEVDQFEFWDITYGEIRYYDTFYRGNDGIWKVKNRIDRIRELSRWLKEDKGFHSIYGDFKKDTPYSSAFKDDMEIFLFPEKRKFRKLEEENKLTGEYYSALDKPEVIELKGQRKRGSGIYWRMDYTRAVFPEEFHELRNSGTLWRDFEEAPRLFFSLYNIDAFFKEMISDQKFIR